ncbi:AGE family epimerase/isomerase [Rubrolithibacter danxiaensis]|uniref:AGE family epimerase/isomerase n=1 Tax=Rubrolithibacter danxiaensis TaxID=3390805 RepID=UPI003BF80B29
MKFIKLACIVLTGLQLTAFAQISNTRKERLEIGDEMKSSMVNELLKQWYPMSVDQQYGGFLSNFTYDFKPSGNQDKMIVTQARHVWSNSRAAELFPDVTHYKTAAKQGYEFLRNVFWDRKYGGFYTYTDRQGNVKNNSFAEKEAYGNSFALYALAAYYRATGDTSALNLAAEEFQWLEKHSHDPVYKGYFQHMKRDGAPITRAASVPSRSELGYKDQNTSIHLLESFTELYSVWPDSLLKQRLQEMLYLVRDTITDKKGYLRLFFQPDWTPVSFKDSSRAVILKHKNLDHVSFGHDVETAYLMLEASHVLGLHHDTTTMRVAKTMVDHALRNGWDSSVGGFYDEGYYFKDKPAIAILADTKNWWAQAEGLNTLLLMADYYPNDSMKYDDKFKKLWTYVQTYLIDHEHGDWYQGGIDKEPKQKTALKGHIWKGTYHHLRALINCINRLDPDNIPPSVPSGLKIAAENNFLTLTWNSSQDDKNLLGYNIYRDGKRVAFTPLTSFKLTVDKKDKSKFSLTSVDFQGNESLESKISVY